MPAREPVAREERRAEERSNDVIKRKNLHVNLNCSICTNKMMKCNLKITVGDQLKRQKWFIFNINYNNDNIIIISKLLKTRFIF